MEEKLSDSEHWFKTPPGSFLLTLEQQQLQTMLSRHFGDILVQLGGPLEVLSSHPSPIVHRIIISDALHSDTKIPFVRANYDELPLRPDSIDVIICMHLLDFAQDPSEILDQIYQSLVPHGQVVIVGFNSVSLWGLQRALKPSSTFPWNGKFHSIAHMKTLLQKTGFTLGAKKNDRFSAGFIEPEIMEKLVGYGAFGSIFISRFRWHLFFIGKKEDFWYASDCRNQRPPPSFSELPMKYEVEIFTDGACRGNPGPGGWGALLRYKDKEKTIYGGEAPTTNNRMELRAAIEALASLKKPCKVRITTDSQYVRKGMMEWLSQWKMRGWKTSDKKPVKNQDLWQALDELVLQHEVTWHWVKGHNGHPENELADRLANQAIDELKK